MTILPSTSRILLLFASLGAATGNRTLAQTASTQAGTPPTAESPSTAPQGKILFERHEAASPDTPAAQESAPAEAAPKPSTEGPVGVSSSNRRSRTTLRRRAAPLAEPTAPILPAPTFDDSAAVLSGVELANPALQDSPLGLTSTDVAAAQQVTATERGTIVVVRQDLDLHLNTQTAVAEVRAQMVLRNRGAWPLRQIPVRISGALRWQSVRLAGASTALPLQQYHLADDLDHTGFATELLVPLAAPLPPGATIALDLYYGGPLTANTGRLTALGAPTGRAALTDWDTVTDSFTGLRGLGNVLWYPVSGKPALLRDGSAVTEAVEASRTQSAESRFFLSLTLQYSGSRPDAAIFCGERQPLIPLAPETPAGDDRGGFVTAQWTRQKLGPHTPSMFVATGSAQEAANNLLHVVTDRADTVAATGEAAIRIRSMLAEWLGAAPARPLDVLDLPIPGATGFADGSLLVAPLTTAPAAALAPALVQPLAAAWLPADIVAPWLREGLPAFLQAVWIERTAGRASALAGLNLISKTMQQQSASADSASQTSSSSQPQAVAPILANPVASCNDPQCARSKAAYVFEMLRNMLGDSGLQQAISGWTVQQSQAPGRTAAEETAGMEQILQQVAGKRDLRWFFTNWIDEDHGLPDLRIVLVAPRRAEKSTPVLSLPQAKRPIAGPIGAEPVAPTDARDMSERDAAALAAASGGGAGPAPGSWLVAVEVQNNGSADAEVPVTVRSGSLTNTLPLRVAAHSRATVRVPFEADPAEVLVNDGSVPEVDTSTHRKSIGSLPVTQ